MVSVLSGEVSVKVENIDHDEVFTAFSESVCAIRGHDMDPLQTGRDSDHDVVGSSILRSLCMNRL